MTIAGLAIPELSAFDPPVSGEGSLDPMGLAALSDRLAERLVPGLRARMQRIRFVTAMAVATVVCEPLEGELPGDGISSPSICFEWLFLEAMTRRLKPSEIPSGVPGSQKARAVIARNQRMSAATYLKGPTVFGFHGVYKPFAVDAGVVTNDLAPGRRAVELVRAWEREHDFDGFVDGVRGSRGARLRDHLTKHTRNTLREGRCTIKPNNWVLGDLARSLHPDQAGPAERAVLRRLIIEGEHEQRSEFARLLADVDGDDLGDAGLLTAVRPRCSAQLGEIIDAVVSYERLAELIDAAFRTLCAVSYAQGTQPLTPALVESNEVIVQAAGELPGAFRSAHDQMAAIARDDGLEERLGEFAIPRGPAELVELLLEHHERIQAAKAPDGKRPWFEPLRNGWVVRGAYGEKVPPELDGSFVHPVRAMALRRFLSETAP